jgi:predicted aspartyl protease
MVRYGYNRDRVPPAPFVHVTVWAPHKVRGLPDLPAQLDTGADQSVIPWPVVEQLGLNPLGEETVMGFDGSVRVVSTFGVELEVRQTEPIRVEVLASRGESWVILGRDVLNHFRIVLDGPQLALEID